MAQVFLLFTVCLFPSPLPARSSNCTNISPCMDWLWWSMGDFAPFGKEQDGVTLLLNLPSAVTMGLCPPYVKATGQVREHRTDWVTDTGVSVTLRKRKVFKRKSWGEPPLLLPAVAPGVACFILAKGAEAATTFPLVKNVVSLSQLHFLKRYPFLSPLLPSPQQLVVISSGWLQLSHCLCAGCCHKHVEVKYNLHCRFLVIYYTLSPITLNMQQGLFIMTAPSLLTTEKGETLWCF